MKSNKIIAVCLLSLLTSDIYADQNGIGKLSLNSPEDFGEVPSVPSTPPPSKTPTPTPTPPPVTPTPPSTPPPSNTPTPTPTLTLTPSLTPSPTLTPTPTPTLTLTPTPTPTPTPNMCDYMSIHISQQSEYAGGGFNEINYKKIRELGTESQVGKCLNSKIDEALSYCNGNSISRNNSGPAYMDDCIMEILMGKSFYSVDKPDKAYYLNSIADNYNPNPNLRNASKDSLPKNYGFADTCTTYAFNGRDFVYSSAPAIDNKCITGGKSSNGQKVDSIYSASVYFDANCNSVNFRPNVPDKCKGEDYLNSSPISLIWDGEIPNSKIVNFTLDESRPLNIYSEWKASKNTPLLVYDPDHSGKITSAKQLFGDWTFGGKQSAMAKDQILNNSKWNNGYEALATLDSNQDGKITGKELKDLSLWFDSNRDGISDKGEVISLTESKVNTLFYRDIKQDPITKDFYLDKGYIRDGQKSGKSIDWYGKSAVTPEELLAKSMVSDLASKIDSNSTEIVSNISKSSESIDKTISGVWKWESAVKAGDKLHTFGGILALDGRDSNLEGFSFTERVLPGTAFSKIGVFKINGQRLSKGNYTFSSTNDGITIESNVSVVKNGLELEGTTTVYNKNGNLSYNWIAQRK